MPELTLDNARVIIGGPLVPVPGGVLVQHSAVVTQGVRCWV